jgi:hypothetical protein
MNGPVFYGKYEWVCVRRGGGGGYKWDCVLWADVNGRCSMGVMNARVFYGKYERLCVLCAFMHGSVFYGRV